mmetsp:Transcript_3534/g.6122  ORF Transcript_3534/g.6122 Transcript_3534/m.6122 type:complete len:209 (+) Transcript_3534:403-1029(+)
MNINNEHHRCQKQYDSPGVGVQKSQPKDAKARIMTLRVVRKSRRYPADPTGTIEKLETKTCEASPQPGHDWDGMHIFLHFLHALFLPSLDHHEKVVHCEADVVAYRAERGGLVEETLRSAGLDGTGRKIRLSLRYGPGTKEAHQRADHITNGHTAQETVVGQASPLLIPEDVLHNERGSAEGKEARALWSNCHGLCDRREAGHGCAQY